MRIDAHQHFWQYSPVEYDWIDDSMAVLRRDFLPADLRQAMTVDETIAVQARQTVEETRWLLGLAAENDFIRGVVGWVPLADRDLKRALEELAADRKLKGVRHVVQAEPDEAFLAREDFNRGIRELRRFGLVYDILVVERQMHSVPAFVDRHPDQQFVLDHLGKPLIKDGAIEPWRTHMRELAKRPNVACKLSGMVTEADFSAWRPEHLKPYVDTALEAFGPRRLMFGSDWPVCLLASSYRRWAETLAGMLSVDEQADVWGGTAARVYS